MESVVIEIRTGGRETVHDLTASCETFLADTAAGDGLLHVWVPHATAGLAVLETGAGSDEDLLAALRELLPADGRWRHRHGSPGHGRDHVLPALCPPYATVPVLGRPDGAGNLAVRLPGRPQRRQPAAPGPPLVPARMRLGLRPDRGEALASGAGGVLTTGDDLGRPAGGDGISGGMW